MNTRKLLLTALVVIASYGSAFSAEQSVLSGPINSKEKIIVDNVQFIDNIVNKYQSMGSAISLNGADASAVISNSLFRNNVTNGSGFSLGGAIFNSSPSLIISNSIFDGNRAFGSNDGNYGGAIFADGSGLNSSVASEMRFNNVTFLGNSVQGGTNISGGGAIASQYIKNIVIDNSRFEKNFASGNSSGTTNYVMGGAIAPSYMLAPIGPNNGVRQALTINNSEFIGNYATNTYKIYGGAIGTITPMDININNSKFSGNYITGGTSARGGVIGAIGAVNLDIKNSSFVGNYIENNPDARGGVIYSQLGKLNIENTDFIGNSVRNGATTIGGAITDIGSTINIKNSSFLNNYVIGTQTASGGAIYFQGNGASVIGTLNLISDGRNVEFTGNTANGLSDAIYQGANTVLNLNTASGNKIVFNDSISSSSNNTTMNINKSTSNLPVDGTVVLNANMNKYVAAINFHNGTIKIGEDGTFFNNASKFTAYDGTTIDLRNGKTQVSNIKNLVLNGVTNVKINADLIEEKIDSFNVASASGSGKFNIEDIDLISGMKDGATNFTKDFITGASNVNSTMDSSLSTIYTQSSKYDVSLNNNSLTFDRSDYSGGLAGAVGENGERQYQMKDDEIVNDWNAPNRNELQGDKLVIKGNQNSVTGSGQGGLLVGKDHEVAVSGVGSIDSSGNVIGSWNGFDSEKGGAINNTEGTTVIKDTIFSNNSAQDKGGAIYNENGVVNIIADANHVVFKNNTANGESNAIHNNGGTINLNSSLDKNIVFNDKITSEDTTGVININASTGDVSSVKDYSPSGGTLVLNNDMSGYKGDVNLYHGTIKVGKDGSFFNPNNFNIYGCTLDFANNAVQNYNLGNLSISDAVDMFVDADLAAGTMDTISSNNLITDAGKINVTNINLLSDASSNSVKINFTGDNLKEAVTYSGDNISYSPLYKYSVNYDKTSGDFDFMRFGGGNSYNNYNPSVFAAPVAAQLGGYFNQLNAYDQAFMNIDMKMLLTQEERQAMKLQNKYAASDTNNPMVFSPTFLQEKERGAWARPYSSFESVSLKGGPKVSNVMYGTFFGGDSEMTELGKGFEGQFSLYAGYNGSHQAYSGNSMYQNGGTLGLTGVVYKGNFFSALTANVGASGVEASTMYGSENFSMLMAGVASKTGYNWELAKGKIIIQPHYLMSYSFINTFDYKNAAGLQIGADPLNAIQISPGIKFIGNLKNGWQPYLSVSMVWNLMDKTNFQAAQVSLPQLSVKPYVEYGVGVQKRWGERFTGFGQAMLRNGGRNGVALSAGFRWALGKTPQHSSAKKVIKSRATT